MLDPVDAVDDDHETIREVNQVLDPSCSCANKESRLMALVKQAIAGRRALTDPQRVHLIDAWYEEVNMGRKREGETIQHKRIYFIHIRAVATSIGVFKRAINAMQLQKLLTRLYLNKDRWHEL